MSIFTNTSGSAPEEIGAYMQALEALLGDRNPREVLGATAAALRDGTEGLAADLSMKPEAPGKWSIAQVAQHLADAELIWGWRVRLVIAHDRPTITPYDQDRWAERLRYDRVALSDALEQFAFLRALNLRLVDGLSDAETRSHVGLHPERGEESVARMMQLAAAHDLMHLRQIDRIRASVAAAAR